MENCFWPPFCWLLNLISIKNWINTNKTKDTDALTLVSVLYVWHGCKTLPSVTILCQHSLRLKKTLNLQSTVKEEHTKTSTFWQYEKFLFASVSVCQILKLTMDFLALGCTSLSLFFWPAFDNQQVFPLLSYFTISLHCIDTMAIMTTIIFINHRKHLII